MLRRDLSIKRRMAEEAQFVTKVANLPAVSSAWTTVSDLYQKTKDSSRVLKYTLDVNEYLVKTVAGTAQPLITTFEDPLKKVNAFACDKLDQLTTSYPIIAAPTDQVITEGKKVIQPAVNTVTAIKDLGVGAYTKSVDTVNGVKQYGIDTVATVTNYGKDQLSKVSNYGQDQLSKVSNYGQDQLSKVSNYGQEKLAEALKTETGQKVGVQLSGVLTTADGFVDKYLPPSEGSEDEKTGGEDEGDVLGQATALKTKLQRRMVKRALKNLVNVRVRSKDVLDKLGVSLNVMEYARRNLDNVVTAGEGVTSQISDTVTSAQTKFWDVWGDITCDQVPPLEEGEDPQSLERRSVVVARQLVSQLRTTITSLQTNLTHLPITVRSKYDDVYKYSEELVAAFKNVNHPSDVSNWMISQARDSIGHLQSTLTSMVEVAMSAAPLNWMANKSGPHNVTSTEMENEKATEPECPPPVDIEMESLS